MDRECDKCVYHTSGSCSQWECKGTVTIDDIRAKTIDEFYNRLLNYKCEINTANYPWNYIWLVDTEMKGGAE